MPVVDVYKIKPFTTNDTLPSNKTFQNNRNNGIMRRICLKALLKALERRQFEIFWVSDLKVFNADFDNVFVCWGLLYYLFVRKIPSF